MEPPKKRKYPEHLDIVPLVTSGSCAVMGVAMEAEHTGGLTPSGTNIDTQQPVVTSQGGPAKRNRRSYSLEFKVAVLDSFYHDPETRLNQRKTAIKYGVNRRQIQKWLAQEETLRGSVGAGYTQNHSLGQVPTPPSTQESPLSPYLSYQSKIDYLRRGSPPHTSGCEEESGYVIDQTGADSPSPTPNYSKEIQDENTPINLSKYTNMVQVKPQDTQGTSAGREQMNEVDSSVATGERGGFGGLVVGQVGGGAVSQARSGRVSQARSNPDPITSHVLDTSQGRPAVGVIVSLWRLGGAVETVGAVQSWTKLQQRTTDNEGRASSFLSSDHFRSGVYKMHFGTGQYFRDRGTESFYPYAEVVFEIKNPEEHHHIPLLLNPFGYTTYCGS